MYVKLFQSIYDGSLATRGPWEALVTFQQMLILCDKTGIIDMTAEAIARRTTLPLNVVETGLKVLEAPDPESRRADNEGRRILRLDPNREWGWQIVNYGHYRSIRTAEERREYMRTYMKKKRAETLVRPPERKKQIPDSLSKPAEPEPFSLPDWINRETWEAWVKIRPAKARSPAALKAACAKLEKFKAEGHDPNQIVANSLANGWQGLFPPKAEAQFNGKSMTHSGNFGRCKYCEKPATRRTGDIAHCDTPRHIDFAIGRN